MARAKRLNIPDVPQHVIQRGNNKQVCFFSELDYRIYLSKLKEYSEKYAVAIHAFVLMTNHVHLLATPATAKGISDLMQNLGGTTFGMSINAIKEPEPCGKDDLNLG